MSFDKALKVVISQSTLSLSTIEALLQNGTNPNIQNNNGYTLLEIAARNKWSTASYVKLIQICLATKKLNANDFSRAFGYYLSFANTINFAIIQAFFDAGANPNTTNDSSHTILEIAAMNSWRDGACNRLIQMIAKCKNMSLIAEKNETETIFTAFKSQKINDVQMASLARKGHAKERLIEYIKTRPEKEKQEILASVFTNGSNLNRFFSVPRGWFQTNLNRGTFKILNDMRKASPDSNVFPITTAAQSKLAETPNYNPSLFKSSKSPIQSDKKDLLSGFICPITFEVMKNPVICILDGRSYEESAITDWLNIKRTTPTGISLQATQSIKDVLVTNRNLAESIEHFKKEMPDLFLEDPQQNYRLN